MDQRLVFRLVALDNVSTSKVGMSRRGQRRHARSSFSMTTEVGAS